jgi:hypothetical protein
MLVEPLRHLSWVNSAQFSPDGKRIVTASLDNMARVWDTESGQLLIEPLKHSSTAQSPQFSPDGKRLVTASLDNTARVWDIAPASASRPGWLLELAEALSGQVLSQQGVMEATGREPAEALKQIRQQLDQPGDDDWVTWGRWFLADPATRTISPFSKLTVPEYIGNRIEENTAESLAEAEQLAYGNPDLLTRISEARSRIEKGKNPDGAKDSAPAKAGSK